MRTERGGKTTSKPENQQGGQKELYLVDNLQCRYLEDRRDSLGSLVRPGQPGYVVRDTVSINRKSGSVQ